jgi:GNAT superfamily N-acetyltransferase
MAEMLASADLMIGAGGTTNWERSALALPAIVIAIADNQRQIVKDLAEDGLIWGLPQLELADVGALTHIIEAALKLTEVNRGMARRLRELVDGKGAERVALALMQCEISVRQAVAGDARDVYAWRNDPLVRAQSLDQKEISPAAHVAWFEKAVKDEDKVLLIGETGSAGMGVVRLDISGDEARVSIYLNPAFRGKGLGLSLLEQAVGWLRGNRRDVSTLTAEVKPDNGPSNVLFVDAGFSPYYQRYVKNLRP